MKKRRAIFYSLLSILLGFANQTKSMDFLSNISKAISYIAPISMYWGGYYGYRHILLPSALSHEESNGNQNNQNPDSSNLNQNADKLSKTYVESIMNKCNYPPETQNKITYNFTKPGIPPFSSRNSVSLPICELDLLLQLKNSDLEQLNQGSKDAIAKYKKAQNNRIDTVANHYNVDRNIVEKALELEGICTDGPKLEAALCHEIGHIHNNHVYKLNLAPLVAWGCVELASRILSMSPAGTYMQNYPYSITAAKLACALVGSTTYFHSAEYQADDEVIKRIKSPEILRNFGDQLAADEMLNNKVLQHDYPMTGFIRTLLPSLTHPSAKNRAQRLYKAADKYDFNRAKQFKFLSSGTSFNLANQTDFKKIINDARDR